MTPQEIQTVLDAHGKWLRSEGGQGADLQRAYLQDAYLQGADLQGADLQGAYLQRAYLQDADLQGANLQGANLQGADLQDANLQGANLQGANLQRAYLQDADLQGANLREAKLPHYQIPQHGELRVYKKACGKIVLLKIPSHAKRTAALMGRKCRASEAIVLAIQGDQSVTTDRGMTYAIGARVLPDSYDPDPRVECSHGIHFFLTRAEAEEWDG